MGLLSRAKRTTPGFATVEIEDGLLAALDEIATMRGTSSQQILGVMVRAYINSFERGRIIGLEDNMPFGKYSGINMEELIRADPRYIGWLQTESDVFKLDNEALKLLNDLLEERR